MLAKIKLTKKSEIVIDLVKEKSSKLALISQNTLAFSKVFGNNKKQNG